MGELLLTGATGMVGREVLARAVTDDRFERIHCLVRPTQAESAQRRLSAVLRGLGLAPDRRVRAVPGDITNRGLGLGPRSLRGVTHIVHGAATVAFDNPLETARRINVDGTGHVLDVARRLPHLERVDTVSTCYIAGRRTGLVAETDLDHTAGFRNTYERTKYEAELMLRTAGRELPITVHRPSIVVGDSRTGATGAWKVLYWPLKVISRGWLPVIPYDPDATLDIVPVDFVADAILALSRDAATVGGTFHLAAGPGRDITVGEMLAHVFALMDRRKPVRVPPAVFRRVVRPALMLVPDERVRRTLHQGLVYRPYLELRVQFDTTRADAALAPHRLACPAVRD